MAQVNINNINLAFDDTGSGRPVILLHGYPFNRTLWGSQIAALKNNFRVITPDLRGFGESEAAEPATMALMAQDVAALMDALDIPKAIIGGLSMGGYVLLSFYKQFTNRVEALVLADTRPQADTEEGKQNRVKQREQILRDGMGLTADTMLPKLLTPETVSTRPDIVNHVRNMIMNTKPAGAAAALMGMATREDQTELLQQIGVPTLIVVGREDPITPVQDSQLMHERVQGSRLIILEDAAHVSNLEQTESFNGVLKSFLRNQNGREATD
jgi:pimeloyl-ACP methyl ester carboxylesterase